MKIAIIGGGSFLWTFGFVRQIVRSRHLRGADVALMDIDPEALELSHRAVEIFNEKHGRPVRITSTQDTDAALDRADFVIVSISTGGLDAMRHDLQIPERYGIWHTVGDTVGPGGWNRAVRNIPVFFDLAERMSRQCPSAWLINVTNPLTVLTRVPHKCFGIRTIGMCPGVEETAKSLATLAGAKPDARRDYLVTGIDHGSFFTSLYADGVDVLAKLEEMKLKRSDDEAIEVKTGDPLAGEVSMRAGFAIWKEIGYLPSIADRHTVENYPWFLTDPSGKLDYGIQPTTIEQRHEWRRKQRERIEKYVNDPSDENVKHMGHGDDPVGLVIEALSGNGSFLWGSNYRNVGQTAQAPPDAVVETRCLFDAAGIHPLPSPMPPILQPLVLPTIYRQEAIIRHRIERVV